MIWLGLEAVAGDDVWCVTLMMFFHVMQSTGGSIQCSLGGTGSRGSGKKRGAHR